MELKEIKDKEKELLQNIERVMPELERYYWEDITEVTEEIKQLDADCDKILTLIINLKNEMKEKKRKVKEVERKIEEEPLENRINGLTKEEYDQIVEEYNELYRLVTHVSQRFVNEYDTLKDKIKRIEKFEERKKEIIKVIRTEDKQPKGQVVYTKHPKVIKISDKIEDISYVPGEKIYTTSKLLELDYLCSKNHEHGALLFKNPKLCLKGVSYKDEEYPKNHAVPVTRYASSCIERKNKDMYSRKEERGCKRVEERIKRICESENEEYDKPGEVSLYVEGPGGGETIKIDITQRELAKAGILPEDLNWICKEKENATITPRSMAEASQKESITSTELAPLEKSGFKNWLENVKESIKNFITGKGER